MKILKRLTVIPMVVIIIATIPITFLLWAFTGKNSPIEIAEKYCEWLNKIDLLPTNTSASGVRNDNY